MSGPNTLNETSSKFPPNPPGSQRLGHDHTFKTEDPRFSPEFAPDSDPNDEFDHIQGNQQQGKDEDENAFYSRIERQTDRRFERQKKAKIDEVFEPEALIFYINHPIEFIEDVFPNPDDPSLPLELDDWQRQVCNHLAGDDGGYVAIAAGSGVGKTWLLSKLIYWFLATRKGVVPCTAPTEHQLFDILWKELKKDWDSSPDLQRIFTWTQTKLFVNGHVATWYAVARTATVRKDGKIQEGLQGFHDKNLFAIVDEASGVADSSMAAVDGALTALNAKIILTSNPTRISGRFYKAFTVSSKAQGGPWNTITVDARKSRFVSKEWCSMMLHEHGEESPIFKAKVTGEFPDQEENALISLTDVECALSGHIACRATLHSVDMKNVAAPHSAGTSSSDVDTNSTTGSPLSHNMNMNMNMNLREGMEDDLEDLEEVRDPIFKSRTFSTEGHEYAAMQFFNKIGFPRMMDGMWPNGRRVVVGQGSYSRPRSFRPPDSLMRGTGIERNRRVA